MTSSEDPVWSRVHYVASLVHSLWTADTGCSVEAALAPHFFDGTYTSLEYFIMASAHELLPIPPIWVKHESSELHYSIFSEKYMASNMPVMISGLTEGWRANDEWTCTSVSGTREPNMSALASRFGHAEVEVELPSRSDESKTDTSAHDASIGYDRPRVRMPLTDFTLESGGYIKDWHFQQEFPEAAAELLPTPHLFQDDWLNDFSKTRSSPHRGCHLNSKETTAEAGGASRASYEFVYCGSASTGTHLHADVLGSYSWSAHVCGAKTWRFLPPHLTTLARDVFGLRLAPDFLPCATATTPTNSSAAADAVAADALAENARGAGPLWQFPLLHAAARQYEEIRQPAGAALFVPSEWLHTVRNDAPTLSANANWVNRHNLLACFRRLSRARAASAARAGAAQAARVLKDRILANQRRARGIEPLLPPPKLSSPSPLPPSEVPALTAELSMSASGELLLSACTFGEAAAAEVTVGVDGGSASADETFGKAAFDIEDFVKLLAWKAQTQPSCRAQGEAEGSEVEGFSKGDSKNHWQGEESGLDEHRERALDLKAVAIVAGLISRADHFGPDICREAARIAHAASESCSAL